MQKIVLILMAVADGKVQPECVMPNMPVLNKLAQISKEALNVPGVKAISSTSTVIR